VHKEERERKEKEIGWFKPV